MLLWKLRRRPFLAVLASLAYFSVSQAATECPGLACHRLSSDALSNCRKKLDVGQDGHYVHYYSSIKGPLSGENVHQNVTGLILILHGIKSDADKYFEVMSSIVRKADACSTVVLAPEWRQRSDNQNTKLLIWPHASFLNGSAAANSPGVYSFSVIDSLIAQAQSAFPRLASVTMVGHSAGAQSLQRYAGANRLTIPVNYIIANAGTYMYLSNQRVSTQALSALNTTCPQAQHSAACNLTGADFTQPWDGAISCPRYDEGKYGLRGLNGSYVAQAGAAFVRSTYPTRRITYLLGDDDTNANAHLDQSCAANAQGLYRKQRGLVYYTYLLLNFPGLQSLQTAVVVPGCGHNETCILSSAQFLSAWSPQATSGL
ncbi:hypothetical protein CVIRNUC_008311 [Coccomyxa viridis]|uniref:Uncharacterized protein n=1 Tax=Coccomyxa viridis TaxID=1274662 RepID=A0AAV1IGG6_9CHLO|nr:hypothetical protein CVIRNUC_008311 [Coccomyxa viridis]